MEAFDRLGRLRAPLALSTQVAEALRFDSTSRAERNMSTLKDMEAFSAPAELEERVFSDLQHALDPLHDPLRDEDRAPQAPELSLGVQALKTLTCHPAPAVLERLLSEELEKPAYHRTNRFSDLERMRAPDQLALSLEKTLRRSRIVRRLQPLVGTLAAAGLVLWLVVGLFAGADGPRKRPFEVVRTDSMEGFHPWLQGGFGALAGPGAPQVESSDTDANLNTGKEIR